MQLVWGHEKTDLLRYQLSQAIASFAICYCAEGTQTRALRLLQSLAHVIMNCTYVDLNITDLRTGKARSACKPPCSFFHNYCDEQKKDTIPYLSC